MYLLKMERMKMGVIRLEVEDEEVRVFSDKDSRAMADI